MKTNSSHRFRWTCPLAFAVGLVLLWSGPSPAQTSADLRQELAEAAKILAKQLQARGEPVIAVGQFSGPATFPTSSGPGIAMILAEELKKNGITVKSRASLGIRGQYYVTEESADWLPDRNIKVLGVRLKGAVEDAFNKPLPGFSFDKVLVGEAAVVELLGTAVDLPSKGTAEMRDKKLRQSLIEPRTVVTEKRIAASAESPYAIEVLVNGQPRDAREDEGLAFINLGKEDSYAIRLINNSDKEAAVRLSIDGMSLFAFSKDRHTQGPNKGEPLYSVVLVPAHKNLIVNGWHRTNKEWTPFVANKYASEDLAILKQKDKLGTITAAFSAAWPDGTLPPPDEAPAPRSVKSRSVGSSPGPEAANFSAVRRNTGVIRSAVSVRYTKQ